MFDMKTNRFIPLFTVWLEVHLKLHFSLYKGVHGLNLKKAPKLYCTLKVSSWRENQVTYFRPNLYKPMVSYLFPQLFIFCLFSLYLFSTAYPNVSQRMFLNYDLENNFVLNYRFSNSYNSPKSCVQSHMFKNLENQRGFFLDNLKNQTRKH